jgi:hypothetical protein
LPAANADSPVPLPKTQSDNLDASVKDSINEKDFAPESLTDKRTT